MNNDTWENIGETRIFDTHKHLIWKIDELEENIITPEGYELVKTDKVTYLRKIYIRKFFKNTVPVKADLYQNSITKEISYYFEGTPITLEKNKTLKKNK